MTLTLPRHASQRVLSPDGVAVAVQDWAAPADAGRLPDVLLLHGFSQSHQCWIRQVGDDRLRSRLRLVTVDLRGHGDSDKPDGDAFYQDPQRWAADVASVIDALQLHRPVLVAWSYAGRIALDYLQHHGDSGVAGLVMVNATSSTLPQMLGPTAALLGTMGDPDPAVSEPATEALLRQCVAGPLPDHALQFMLAYNRRVPARVRAQMRRPGLDYGATLNALRIPVLVVHGDQDTINLPAMAHYTASQAPQSRLLMYEGVGHTAFWEQPERFNHDLLAFVEGCHAGR